MAREGETHPKEGRLPMRTLRNQKPGTPGAPSPLLPGGKRAATRSPGSLPDLPPDRGPRVAGRTAAIPAPGQVSKRSPTGSLWMKYLAGIGLPTARAVMAGLSDNERRFLDALDLIRKCEMESRGVRLHWYNPKWEAKQDRRTDFPFREIWRARRLARKRFLAGAEVSAEIHDDPRDPYSRVKLIWTAFEKPASDYVN